MGQQASRTAARVDNEAYLQSPPHLATYSERLLLLLAPKDPIRNTVSEHLISRVKLFMVKDGKYLGRSAQLVLLDVELARQKIKDLSLDIHLKSVPVEQPSVPDDSQHHDTVPEPQPPAPTPPTVHFLQRLRSLPLALDTLQSAVVSTFSGPPSRNLTESEFVPPPRSLSPVVVAPANIQGPIIDVSHHAGLELALDPKVDGGVAGGELGNFKYSASEDQRTTPGATVSVLASSFGLSVQARSPKYKQGSCPRFFRIGFVVEVPDSARVSLEVVPCPGKLPKSISWSTSYRKLLYDSTYNGRRTSAATCGRGMDGEECQPGCRDFHQSHMTEAVWKKLLAIGSLLSFNRTANTGNWARHVND